MKRLLSLDIYTDASNFTGSLFILNIKSSILLTFQGTL
jgi:hypothetical protein